MSGDLVWACGKGGTCVCVCVVALSFFSILNLNHPFFFCPFWSGLNFHRFFSFSSPFCLSLAVKAGYTCVATLPNSFFYHTKEWIHLFCPFCICGSGECIARLLLDHVWLAVRSRMMARWRLEPRGRSELDSGSTQSRLLITLLSATRRHSSIIFVCSFLGFT
jgi:hypothetical protein